MKVSQKQKEANRRKLIEAAIDLITEKGFKAATMRDIAKRAKMGEATIYTYFPTKEQVVYAAYGMFHAEACAKVAAVKTLAQHTLREKMQLLVDVSLEQYLQRREFVAETFAMALLYPPGYRDGSAPARAHFTGMADAFFDNAIKKQEIPDQPYRSFAPALIWDYYLGITAYWLRDTSDQFTDTTLLVDKSLAMGEAVLKSGLLNHVSDLASFFWRTHVQSMLDHLAAGMGHAKAHARPHTAKGKKHGKK